MTTITTDIAELRAPAVAAPAPRARRLSDYYELTKPRMNFLVVVTTAVGYFMAPRAAGQWITLLHTIFGTALTAAAAGILNQYIERAHDRLMDRTADRPLPAGRIAPVEALFFGVILAVAGLTDLLYFVNPLTASLAAITLGSYVFIYTPLKRHTTLCTLV